MKVEIIAENDESFTLNPEPVSSNIECKPFGHLWIAFDGETTAVGSTEQDAINELVRITSFPTPIVEIEQVVEETPQPPPIERGTRIENFTETNSFDWFSGTSWAGKKSGFD